MKEKNIAYKVVTQNLQSLGLRKNPNIMTFKLDEWIYLPKKDIVSGKGDWGGIWVAKQKSGATKLKKYMKNKYNIDTRIFVTQIDNILFSNSYRIKTNGVRLLEEIMLNN